MRKLYAILIEQFSNGFLSTVVLALLKIKHKWTIKAKRTQRDILLVRLAFSRKWKNNTICFGDDSCKRKTNNLKQV